jgi:magnesium transporter
MRCLTGCSAPRPPNPLRGALRRESADLRIILRRVGHSGDLASKIRDSLPGIGRIVPGVSRLAADWLPPEVKPRLDTVRQDVLSLSDYDAHTSTKFSCCSTPPSA